MFTEAPTVMWSNRDVFGTIYTPPVHWCRGSTPCTSTHGEVAASPSEDFESSPRNFAAASPKMSGNHTKTIYNLLFVYI